MKVILNKDLSPLGEEGDVKDVAKGYARNYLFPRGIAVPYNDRTIKIFESRREEIEDRKAQKRTDAAGLKERLESLNLEISMPAGANGKLYGAVTSQTIMDELVKLGFRIERKKIELPAPSLKNVGKHKVMIKLYESSSAEITVNIMGQEIKSETKTSASARTGRRHHGSDSFGYRGSRGTREIAENKPQESQAESPAAGESQAEDNANPEGQTASSPDTSAITASAEPSGDSQ